MPGLPLPLTTKTFAALDEIVRRHNRATDGTILAAYEYVNIVGTRAD
jgi:hypothetical protein